MNISFERISNRPRLAGETTTQPVPCDLQNTSRDLEIPSLLFPVGRGEFAQTMLDILAVVAWSVFGLVFGLGLFLATFFLFGGEF